MKTQIFHNAKKYNFPKNNNPLIKKKKRNPKILLKILENSINN